VTERDRGEGVQNGRLSVTYFVDGPYDKQTDVCFRFTY